MPVMRLLLLLISFIRVFLYIKKNISLNFDKLLSHLYFISKFSLVFPNIFVKLNDEYIHKKRYFHHPWIFFLDYFFFYQRTLWLDNASISMQYMF